MAPQSSVQERHWDDTVIIAQENFLLIEDTSSLMNWKSSKVMLDQQLDKLY